MKIIIKWLNDGKPAPEQPAPEKPASKQATVTPASISGLVTTPEPPAQPAGEVKQERIITRDFINELVKEYPDKTVDQMLSLVNSTSVVIKNGKPLNWSSPIYQVTSVIIKREIDASLKKNAFSALDRDEDLHIDLLDGLDG
jgi:hypothetical protein